jgi:hypothetical protein
MNEGKSVFSQITNLYSRYSFNKIVSKYKGDFNTRAFSCWDQFLSMSFAQITYRASLRDIEVCLNAQPNRLYHMGIKGNPTRTNLANANQSRDWRIYFEFAQILIARARKLYQDDKSFSEELDNTVYALDATTIDLCLSIFPWAKFRKTKGAVKLHTLLDIKGSIPSFIKITDGSVHDVNILDQLVLEPGSFYVMDRGYLDFKRLYQIHKHLCYFVIRAKKNMKFKRLYSMPVDPTTKLRSDQIGVFEGFYSRKDYPEKIRRVRIYDAKTDKYLVFLSNNLKIPASLIADLYKNRWKIELFFKWIKQHLRIKQFYGTSFNAVRTQIWIAICVYVTVAILKKTCNISVSLYTILQVLSVTVFEKVPIYQLFENEIYSSTNLDSSNQLSLFDYSTGH